MLDFSMFFPAGSRPAQPMLGDGVLLHGARSSGKTSFAFQAAVNCVLAGGAVVVLCQEAAVYAKMPRPFVSLTSLSQEALNRVEFIYVDSWPAVRRELVQLTRQRAAMPTLLLIDDEGLLVTEEGEDGYGGGSVGGCANTAAGGRGGRAGTAAGSHSPLHAMAQCLSFLESTADWLVRRNGQPFTFVVVSNSSLAASPASSSSSGGGGGGGGGGAAHSSGAVGLPLAAFPIVRAHFGASGSVLVTPLPADRADGVRTSFSLHWDNGLRL